MTDKIKIRQATAVDMPFIYATWLRGLYYGNEWFRQIEKQEFFKSYHKYLEALLAKSRVDVACLAEDEDVILGYAVYDETALHWVFVKRSWRKMGVAKLLVPSEPVYCTHLTELGKSIRPNIKFNPFI